VEYIPAWGCGGELGVAGMVDQEVFRGEEGGVDACGFTND